MKSKLLKNVLYIFLAVVIFMVCGALTLIITMPLLFSTNVSTPEILLAISVCLAFVAIITALIVFYPPMWLKIKEDKGRVDIFEIRKKHVYAPNYYYNTKQKDVVDGNHNLVEDLKGCIVTTNFRSEGFVDPTFIPIKITFIQMAGSGRYLVEADILIDEKYICEIKRKDDGYFVAENEHLGDVFFEPNRYRHLKIGDKPTCRFTILKNGNTILMQL